MARQWGREVALGETRALLDLVRAPSVSESPAGRPRANLYGVTSSHARGPDRRGNLIDLLAHDRHQDRLIRRAETCDLPAALFKTIGRLDHCFSSLNLGISHEFRSSFANRLARDSSDHCSTD
jgi:hypothetical protein